MSKRPSVGALVRVTDTYEVVHICTVVDLLSVQFRATYEVARDDGGWTEHSVFAFYNDDNWEPYLKPKGRGTPPRGQPPL